SAIGDQDARQLFPRTVEHGDVAYALHERAAGLLRERGEELIASCAIPTRGLHLDELVILEGTDRLRRHRGCQSRVSETDHGLHGMRERPQVLALALR